VKDIFRVQRMWRPRSALKGRYDAIIVGGGSHGLATAYYLAKNHGITDVAVLEKSYIGSGAAGRNTTIIRANYRTTEGAEFYKESVRLYEGLSAELDFNLLFSQQGHLTLAHSDRGMITATERAEVNQLLGIDSRVVYPEEIARLCPEMDLSQDVTWPVLGALYHPPGGIIRHDAVVWGYARGADRQGVEIHPYTEVVGIERSNGRVTGVETNRGRVATDMVVSATAGWSTLVADLAGVPLPITTHILQAFVTEPVKPFLHVIIVSSQMHIYLSQTDRGEFLIGAEIEPYTSYSNKGTFPFLEYSARHAIELFPQLEHVKVLRQWTGICDLSPDYSPILGKTELDGFLVSTGWGTYGFKAAPIVGTTLAELVATGETPGLIAPFALERFSTDTLVSELAAAAVSH
jgi:sarcosine oxidase, subunit beta